MGLPWDGSHVCLCSGLNGRHQESWTACLPSHPLQSDACVTHTFLLTRVGLGVDEGVGLGNGDGLNLGFGEGIGLGVGLGVGATVLTGLEDRCLQKLHVLHIAVD